MARFLFKVIICALLAGAASLAYHFMRSGDPLYTFYEWISPARFQQHDALIRAVAAEHRLDPMLVKAVVWQESRFEPQKFGTAGERGLMQLTEGGGPGMGGGQQEGEFPGGGIVRSENESRSRLVVFAPGHGSLAKPGGADSVRAGRIQCRGQPCPALGRRRRRQRHSRRHFRANIDFPGRANTWIRSSPATSSTSGAGGCRDLPARLP